jgi:hypothetical protein
MANVIEQIMRPGNYGSQTIEITVRSNERGPQGEKGDPGEPASVDAGQAYVLDYGQQPQVVNSGTSSEAVLDFYIPEGKPGAIHYYAGPGINITDDNRIEATGEMAVYWGDLVGSMSNQTDLMNALNAKQDNLTAGANVQINNNTISATDTTYNDFVGSTSTLAGTNGLVPAPTTTVKDGVLKASGIWGLVESANIANSAVSTDKIAGGAVNSAKLGSSSVTTDKIAGEAVTAAKLDRQSVIDLFYPVGSYYETSDASFNPNTAWGGTWVEDSKGRVTVSRDDTGTFETIGSIGGEQNHTLTEAELPNISGKATLHSSAAGTNIHVVDGHFSSDVLNTSVYRNGGEQSSGADSYGTLIYSFGGDQPHNNLQPYVVVKRWHRTA